MLAVLKETFEENGAVVGFKLKGVWYNEILLLGRGLKSCKYLLAIYLKKNP